MAQKFDDSEGVWRTIGGRRVFIRTGQSLSDAMKESGKFNGMSKAAVESSIKANNDDKKVKKELDEKQKETKLSERDAKDLLKQLNDEGSDFSFDEDITIEDGKLKTNVGVFMPDERGYVNRDLEIPIDDNETYDSLEEKLRDWQYRHDTPDAFEDEDFPKANKDIDAHKELEKQNESISHLYNVKETENGYKGKGKELLKFIENEEQDSGVEISDALKDKLRKNPNDTFVFDNENETIEAYKKAKEDDEYELYKKARENEDSIDPMTENSTDWEQLDKKYKERYEKENKSFEENQKQLQSKLTSKQVQDVQFANDKALNHKIWDADISSISITTNSINDSYGYGFNEMLNTADREGLKVKSVSIGNLGQNKASIDFENGAKLDFYDLKEGKALINNADTDDFEKIQKALNTYRVKSKEDVSYDFNNGGWINNNENTKISGMNNSKYEAKYENQTKSTNDTTSQEYDAFKGTPYERKYKSVDEAIKDPNSNMNKYIREKASKKSTFKDDLPKHTEIKTQGTSNRKEVSENIQAHILEHYDSPQDFIDQMDAISWQPTNWHKGQQLAEDGFYEIYYDDQRKFLDDLKINPKGKNFDDTRVFETYKSLIGRESAKLYDRLQKNAYNKYKQQHPLTKMSLEEFIKSRKK